MLRLPLLLASFATLSSCAPTPFQLAPLAPAHVSYICAPTLPFDDGSATLSERNKTVLADLLDGKGCPAWSALRRSPNFSLLVRGHADRTGAAEANMALSLRRAEATRDFLISRGISRDRIEVVAYGNTRPGSAREVVVSLALNGKEQHYF